jgi:hypothetical protein
MSTMPAGVPLSGEIGKAAAIKRVLRSKIKNSLLISFTSIIVLDFYI